MACVPKTMDWGELCDDVCSATISFLGVADNLRLNSAMTYCETRHLFVALYRDLRCPAFVKYRYTDEDDYTALRRMMSRDDAGDIMDIIIYYVTRGRLKHLDDLSCESTALTIASRKGYVGIVRELLSAGADKDKADNDDWTPLLWAVEDGHAEVVEVLLVTGADKDKAETGGMTPLVWASTHGHVGIVQMLLAVGADKDKADNNGLSP